MLHDEALCSVIEFATAQICDMIEHGEVEHPTFRLRRAFVRILNVLPMTCWSFHRIAHQHAAFEYVLFYERIHLGFSSPHYFLDGLPQSVQLFSGSTHMAQKLVDSQLAKLKYKDIIGDRLSTMSKLERMKKIDSRKMQLCKESRGDLHNSIPGPVCVLIARCRAVCQGVRRVKNARLFVQCANCNCNRVFYTGEFHERWHASVDDDDAEDDESIYWQRLFSVNGTNSTYECATKRFCSQACTLEHSIHLQAMLPDSGPLLDADDAATRVGRSRVAQSLKLALKRNEHAARSLRNSRSRVRGNLAVDSKEIQAHRDMHIDALNVDVGILYAASIIAESSVLSKHKLLPGSKLYWRDDALYWARALACVTKIYIGMKRKEGIVSSLLTMPRFLEVIQAKAHTMF